MFRLGGAGSLGKFLATPLTNQRKFNTFGTINVCIPEQKIASYLKLKKDDCLLVRVRMLSPNSVRNVSLSSARTRPNLQI